VQVTVSARHGHLDEATQAQLKEKGEKLLHFFNRLTQIEITVDLHREHTNKVKVEVRAHAEHKHEFVGRDEHEELLPAFNKACDHVKQQIKHYKEKIQDHRRDPATGDGAS
jgi:putative sigma-54 modulation protein